MCFRDTEDGTGQLWVDLCKERVEEEAQTRSVSRRGVQAFERGVVAVEGQEPVLGERV